MFYGGCTFQEHESSTWAHLQAEIPTKVGGAIGHRSLLRAWHQRPPPGNRDVTAGPEQWAAPLPTCWDLWACLQVGFGVCHVLVNLVVLCFGVIVIVSRWLGYWGTGPHLNASQATHRNIQNSGVSRPERHWKVALVCWEPCFEALGYGVQIRRMLCTAILVVTFTALAVYRIHRIHLS